MVTNTMRCGCRWLYMVQWSLGLLLLAPKYAFAEGYCIEQWACVDIDTGGQQVQFHLENRRPYPITITLLVKAENYRRGMNRSDRYEVTQVLTNVGKHEALVLVEDDPTSTSRFRYEFKWTPGNMHAVHDVDTTYRRPYKPGQGIYMVQGFNGGYSHYGASRYAVDFAMPVGTRIYAARGGTVIDVVEHHNKGGASRRYAKYANFIVVLHDDGTTGEYYHLRHRGAEVDVGQQVDEGSFLGYSGNTGFSSLPHLHFAVYRAKSHGGYESLPFEFAASE